jgi:methionyl-tRNA formyltransferase
LSEQPLNLLVLTCGVLGFEVAKRVRASSGIGEITVVTTPYRQRRRTLVGKVRHLYRMQGLPGFVALAKRKLRAHGGDRFDIRQLAPTLVGTASLAHLHFDDFHDADCVAALQQLRPDLGLVVGTYILGEEVFTIPRMGCINLHCGKAPEYRGSAPGFWEMYNGESRVGVTIHRVTARLDAGAILRQELFPIAAAPSGDPVQYLASYRRDVLQPNGARLMVAAVEDLVQGRVTERQQAWAAGHTYPPPDYKAMKELRRRVTQRRVCGVA